MAQLQLRSAKVLLVIALGVLPAACSSKDDRSLLIVNLEVAAGADMTALASVHLTVSKDGSQVKTFDVPWNQTAGRQLQVGLYMPSGITGRVTITGTGRAADGSPIFQSKVAVDVDLKTGGTTSPVTIELVAAGVTPPVPDAGVDTGVAPDVVDPGADASDMQPPNGDGPLPDVGGVDAAVDGLGQTDAMVPGDDAGDAVLPGDDAKDVSVLPEVSDTVPPPADTRDAPADDTVGPEVGHTPVWEPAQNIENDPINPSFEPVIAVDPVNEHVYVAWDEATTVKVKRWNRVTAAWEKTVTVETRGNPVTPGIGVDASGNVLLVWGQNTGVASVDGVWTSRTTDGSSWSPAARFTADPSFGVHLAVARNGTAHAAFNKQGSGWPLFTAYYDGTGWTENPTTLDPNPTFFDSEPRIALSATGDGLLIFRKNWGVAGTVLTGQSFTTPIMLDPNYENVTAYDQSIAINRNGQGMVLWSEASSSNTLLLGRTYNPGVGWSSVLPPIVTAQTVAATAVALDEQNNATLLWQQNTAGGVNLVSMHGSPTGPWSEVTALETDNLAGALGLTSEYASPSVAIDGNGNILAVWRKEVSTSTTTFGAYATQSAGGSWLPQAKLGLKTGFDIAGLSVTVADSGFGVATFLYQTDETTSDTDVDNVMVAFFR
jgi:hypothetical protein